MCRAYKVIFEIVERKNAVPIERKYCFSGPYEKRVAFQIANDVLCDYILDMGLYSGSIKKISVIK